MINLWANISETLGLYGKRESDIHPHAPDEKAHLFHSASGSGTEWEYLNLLYALVLATKPSRIIETGTANGFGTLALASALRANGQGTVVTVDKGPCQQAKDLVRRFDLSSSVTFVQSDAYAHCATTEDNYDFAFFDSDVNARHRECSLLMRRKKITGFALFHDASPLRFAHGCNCEMVEWIEQRQHFLFPLSRGLAMLKM